MPVSIDRVAGSHRSDEAGSGVAQARHRIVSRTIARKEPGCRLYRDAEEDEAGPEHDGADDQARVGRKKPWHQEAHGDSDRPEQHRQTKPDAVPDLAGVYRKEDGEYRIHRKQSADPRAGRPQFERKQRHHELARLEATVVQEQDGQQKEYARMNRGSFGGRRGRCHDVPAEARSTHRCCARSALSIEVVQQQAGRRSRRHAHDGRWQASSPLRAHDELRRIGVELEHHGIGAMAPHCSGHGTLPGTGREKNPAFAQALDFVCSRMCLTEQPAAFRLAARSPDDDFPAQSSLHEDVRDICARPWQVLLMDAERSTCGCLDVGDMDRGQEFAVGVDLELQ